MVERRTFDPEGDHPEAGGKEDRLLPWKQVKDVVGLSRSTAWRLQRIGDFPEPVRISLNRVGWWESELTAWKAVRGAGRPLKPPSRPRLPGMPRLSPKRGAAEAPKALDLRENPPTVSTSREALVEAAPRLRGRKRAARTASADQLGFDF